MSSKIVLAITLHQAEVLVARISRPPKEWPAASARALAALRRRGLLSARSDDVRTLTTAGMHLAAALRALGLHR